MTPVERQVTLNGFELTKTEIQFLERLHCGPIATGQYWLNYHTGMWGNRQEAPVQAHISAPCGQVPQRDNVNEPIDHTLITAHDLCPDCLKQLP